MKSKSEITSKPKELLQKPHENCDFFCEHNSIRYKNMSFKSWNFLTLNIYLNLLGRNAENSENFSPFVVTREKKSLTFFFFLPF